MIKEILEHAEDVNVDDMKLYFITRVCKPGVNKRSRVLEKFNFNLYQVDIDNEIRNHLHELTIDQLGNMQRNNFEITDYDVISDDTQQIFSYQMKNKTMAFADVIYNKLPNKSSIKTIKNIECILSEEEMWAYSVGFEKDDEWFYTFRKVVKSRVAIDEKKGNKKNTAIQAIRTRFNTESNKLELIHGETVNLDRQIDCVYYNDAFYIFRKSSFEQITGLAEEFKIQAELIVEELKKSEIIKGIDILKKEVKEKPALHKKMIRLQKIGNYTNLTAMDIKKMQRVAEKTGDKLKCENGKILIEDVTDIDSALRMLCDYYKEGMVSGKNYGTYAGKQLSLN